MNRRLSRHRWLSGAMFWLFLMASLAPAVSRMLAGADPAGHMQHAHHAHHGHHGHHGARLQHHHPHQPAGDAASQAMASDTIRTATAQQAHHVHHAHQSHHAAHQAGHAHQAHHTRHEHHKHQAQHAHHAGHADHAGHASAQQPAPPVSGHPDQAAVVMDDEGAAPASLFTLSDMLDCCPLCAVMGDRLAPVLQVMPLFAVRAPVRAPPRVVVAAAPVSTVLLIPQPRAPPSFRPALSGQARVFSSRSFA